MGTVKSGAGRSKVARKVAVTASRSVGRSSLRKGGAAASLPQKSPAKQGRPSSRLTAEKSRPDEVNGLTPAKRGRGRPRKDAAARSAGALVSKDKSAVPLLGKRKAANAAKIGGSPVAAVQKASQGVSTRGQRAQPKAGVAITGKAAVKDLSAQRQGGRLPRKLQPVESRKPVRMSLSAAPVAKRKPGRPPKVRPEALAAAPEAKRAPGRPAKITSAAGAVVRKSSAAAAAHAPASKRTSRRISPRQGAAAATTTSGAAAANAPATKRKVGRPTKRMAAAKAAERDAKRAPSHASKGQPPKLEQERGVTQQGDATAVKRKPGRPPKRKMVEEDGQEVHPQDVENAVIAVAAQAPKRRGRPTKKPRVEDALPAAEVAAAPAHQPEPSAVGEARSAVEELVVGSPSSRRMAGRSRKAPTPNASALQRLAPMGSERNGRASSARTRSAYAK